MLFRRSHGSPAWHFCRNCSRWPESGYDEEAQEPKTGLCSECTRRLTELTCESEPQEGAS